AAAALRPDTVTADLPAGLIEHFFGLGDAIAEPAHEPRVGAEDRRRDHRLNHGRRCRARRLSRSHDGRCRARPPAAPRDPDRGRTRTRREPTLAADSRGTPKAACTAPDSSASARAFASGTNLKVSR